MLESVALEKLRAEFVDNLELTMGAYEADTKGSGVSPKETV